MDEKNQDPEVFKIREKFRVKTYVASTLPQEPVALGNWLDMLFRREMARAHAAGEDRGEACGRFADFLRPVPERMPKSRQLLGYIAYCEWLAGQRKLDAVRGPVIDALQEHKTQTLDEGFEDICEAYQQHSGFYVERTLCMVHSAEEPLAGRSRPRGRLMSVDDPAYVLE